MDILEDIEWFHANRPGEPVVLTLYHGTTHRFDRFDPQNLNGESMFGAGYYFSSSLEDARGNYASDSGPDLLNRIEVEAEDLVNTEVFEDHDDAAASVRNRLYGGEDAVLTVEVQLNNPLIIGAGLPHRMCPDMEDLYAAACEEVCGEADPDDIDGDTEDQVYEKLDELRDAASKSLIGHLDRALQKLGMTREHDDADALFTELFAECGTVDEVFRKARKEEPYLYLFTDSNGRMHPGAVVAEVFRQAGHDAIIQLAAEKQCHNMNMDSETVHVVIAPDSPQQIRIIDRLELKIEEPEPTW